MTSFIIPEPLPVFKLHRYRDTSELLGDGAGHNTIQDLTDFGLTGSHPPESWLSGNHPIGQQLAALSSSQRRQERHMPARGRRLPGSRY